MRKKLRVAAYAICVRDGQLLLARWINEGRPEWTLPGGGMEHGEDLHDTVLREVEEEAGNCATRSAGPRTWPSGTTWTRYPP